MAKDIRGLEIREGDHIAWGVRDGNTGALRTGHVIAVIGRTVRAKCEQLTWENKPMRTVNLTYHDRIACMRET